MSPNPNPGAQVAGNEETEFQAFLQKTIQEEVARATQAANPAAPAQTAPVSAPAPIALNLGGQQFSFQTPEELNNAVAGLIAQQQGQIQALQAQMNQPKGAEVSGKDEIPQFTLETFVNKMTTNPIEAFDYVDQVRYGVKNPAQAIKETLAAKEEMDRIKQTLAVYQFRDNHPEYQANPQAANVINGIMQTHSLPFDVNGLEAAYGIAVSRGMIQNQNPQMMQNPPAQQRPNNVYSMPGQPAQNFMPPAFNQQFQPSQQAYYPPVAPPPQPGRNTYDPPMDIYKQAEDLTPEQIMSIFRQMPNQG